MEKTIGTKVLIDEFSVTRRGSRFIFRCYSKPGKENTYEMSKDGGLKFFMIFKSIYEEAKEYRDEYTTGDYLYA